MRILQKTCSTSVRRAHSSTQSLGQRGWSGRRITLIAKIALVAALLLPLGCRRNQFPDVPAGYREFAYVSNGASNTVTVLDLVKVSPDRTLQVGVDPTGMAVNPKRNEVYVVNAGTVTGNGSVSVIDTDVNRVVATIPVHKLPYLIDVDADGKRAYVANTGSNTVSVIDLDHRREIGVIGTGEQPGLARISPDMRSLVVTNRASGSVSIFAVQPLAESQSTAAKQPLPQLRAVYSGCPGATDAVVLRDSSKAFVACSGGHQVMTISLAAAPDTWAAKHNESLLADHLLALLNVGQTPVQLALKPDDGEIFCSNFGSDSVSEIETQTNEVGTTFMIGSKPVFGVVGSGVVGSDNSTLWVSNFGGDSVNLWNIEDGKMDGSIRTGHAPDALAFSFDKHLLLAADARSADVAVIRTTDKKGEATLFTILPAGNSPNAIVIKPMQAKP